MLLERTKIVFSPLTLDRTSICLLCHIGLLTRFARRIYTYIFMIYNMYAPSCTTFMNPISISPEAMQSASVVNPHEIVCVHPRDLLRLVHIVNVLIDDYNNRHREISHEAL